MASRSASQRFRSLDVFGQTLNFMYKGEHTYSSYTGAFFTLLTYLLVAGYSLNMTIVMINRDNTMQFQNILSNGLDT